MKSIQMKCSGDDKQNVCGQRDKETQQEYVEHTDYKRKGWHDAMIQANDWSSC